MTKEMMERNNSPKTKDHVSLEDAERSGSSDTNRKNCTYYTATDMLNTMNQAMQEFSSSEDNNSTNPTVELHQRMPDGRTIPVDHSIRKATDTQMMLKQTADRLSCLTAEEKLEWARNQRFEGNKLFTEQKYEEAMDIYLTCLVAVDYTNNNKYQDNHEKKLQYQQRREVMEREVQLPVLLNLAACALKLSQYKKVEQFCNIALTDLSSSSSSKENAKLWYRRGKARMLTGQYDTAIEDFQTAYKLVVAADGSTAERVAIQRDISKTTTLKKKAKVNHTKYKDAMKSVFQQGSTTLYYGDNEKDQHRPSYSTLVASSSTSTSSTVPYRGALAPKTEPTFEEIGFIGWATNIFGECFRRIVTKFQSWSKAYNNKSKHAKKQP